VGHAEIPGIIGDGYLTLTRLLAGDSRPYSGRVAIEHGTIAENLAHYFYASEQTRTSVSLSMVFSDDGSVAGAGGLFLQLMPDAEDSLPTPIEQTVMDLPSLGEYFATGGRPISLVQEHFFEFSPVHLSSEPLRFYCSCSKERFGSFLAALPDEEKSSILEEGPFPLETVCHNCNSRYAFERDEVHELFSN
jgi:molecular chaperone Hsp33